jgi:hypothetical protein
MNATERTYISTTDTAKELRKALKEAFGSVKFSVKSRKYSMGSSIDVKWTDGPTVHMVEKVANRFQGASFDGMQDLKSFHTSIHNGQRVHWGADYVLCSRTISQIILQNAADRIARRYGIDDMPGIMVNRWGSPVLDQAHPNTHRRLDERSMDDISDLVHQESRRLYSYNETIYRVID